MWVLVSGGEPILVVPERVEHFGEAPSHEKMIADFATIVSSMEWACRCGEKVGDDPEIWGAVAELLILGTRSCDPNGAVLGGLRRICHTAAPTTSSLFRHTDHSCNDKVLQIVVQLFRSMPSR